MMSLHGARIISPLPSFSLLPLATPFFPEKISTNKGNTNGLNSSICLKTLSSRSVFPGLLRVMLETMFPRVKLERKTSPKKFVAANGEQVKDLGEKNIPFKTNEGVQRCITCRNANVVKLSFPCKRSSKLETLLCWMNRIRTFGTLVTEQ